MPSASTACRAWWRCRSSPRPWGRRLPCGSLRGGALVLAWLAPLLAAAGGYRAYRRIGSEHFGALLPHTSILYGAGWGALAHNLTVLAKWGLQGVLPGGLALLLLWALAA